MADEKVEEKSPIQQTAELEKIQKDLLERVQKTAAEVNDVLVKNGFEFQVTHKIVMNPDLKQEEIFHDIVLRPKRK